VLVHSGAKDLILRQCHLSNLSGHHPRIRKPELQNGRAHGALTFSTAGVSVELRKFSRFNNDKNAMVQISHPAQGISR
jgi:hypothetical protein